MSKHWDTHENLYKLYIKDGLSISKIAQLYNCGKTNINNKLKKHGIKSRSSGDAAKMIHEYKWDNFENLSKLYINKKLSSYQIANIYNVSNNVILRKLKKHKIKIRTSNEYDIPEPTSYKWDTYDNLKHKYVELRMSLNSIAKLYNVSAWTISNRLKKHKIAIRSSAESIKLSCCVPKWANFHNLYNKYCNDKMSTTDIASLYNVTHRTVVRWLKEHNIKLRTWKEANAVYNNNRIESYHWNQKDNLYNKYVIKQMSATQIASLYDVSSQNILNRLREHNIPIRSRSEQSKLTSIRPEVKEKMAIAMNNKRKVSKLQELFYSLLTDINIKHYREYNDGPDDLELKIGGWNFDCRIHLKKHQLKKTIANLGNTLVTGWFLYTRLSKRCWNENTSG